MATKQSAERKRAAKAATKLGVGALMKRDPKNFNISLAELSPAARNEIRRLRTRLQGTIAQAVRVALDQWAREIDSGNTIGRAGKQGGRTNGGSK